jgi:hypothetical protein
MDKFQIITKVNDRDFDRRDYFEKCIKNFIGKEISIKIKKNTETRSDRQNRYYWLYLKIIERETGNESNDMHEYFKRLFLPPVFITVFGKEIKIPKSTTKLDKFEFGEYIRRIENMTGILAPDVNDLYL